MMAKLKQSYPSQSLKPGLLGSLWYDAAKNITAGNKEELIGYQKK